ncbi:cytochrome c [Candidatus Sumerlaeota bacterium]|nr:cytochrome c [Candidatus Sumerlaeota bacterium]
MKNSGLMGAVIFALAVCASWADDDTQVVSFAKDVAPVFFKNCVSCHHPGEIGPMSLMDYASARPYAKSIKKAVLARTMPPFSADTKLVKYANDISLDEKDIQTIARWADQGAIEGNPSDMPSPPVFNDTWAMGQPDMIFHATTDFLVPANNNEIEYQAVTFDTSALTDDLYIAGWELRPSELGVVHHANLAISPKSFEGIPSGNIIPHGVISGGDYIGSYLPGCRPMMYPEGMAYRLPKGSFLGIQVHYVGKDKDVKNHLMFGVKFAQGRIDKLVRIVGLFGIDGGINIPPGEPNYKLEGQAKFLYDTLILSSGAHMHLRGKDYLTDNVLADGTSKLVTSVPKYDFNWQSNYWLAEPVRAPKGSFLRTVAHYDNSPGNPNNPDPKAWVKNGPWTTDEMLNAWSHCVVADEKLGLKIENGKVAGKFPDAQEKPHPRFLQAVDLNAMNVNKDAEFFNQKGVDVKGVNPNVSQN